MTNNPLYGKYITFNGDSICAGAGFPGGYAIIIAHENSMKQENIAVSGGTVISGLFGGSQRHCISETIDKMDADADYAIIEGGINDAGLCLALGEITQGYDDELDEKTFYGAFELMLKRLITRFAGKKYGYIAVHQATANYRSINESSTSYFYAAKKCCEKWGVPFLDLNSTVPPFGFLPKTSSELYSIREKYTYNADGLHPNEDGYRKYYVPKITEWLKTL